MGEERRGAEGLTPRDSGVGDGTLNRQPSRPPVTTGLGKTQRRRGRRGRAKGKLPQLHRGKRGDEVRKVQRLLNSRIVPSPRLRVDGVFGPKTDAATRVFQKGRTIKIDGIVGPVTWAHVLGGQKVKLPPVPVKGMSNPATELELVAIPPPAPVVVRASVWDWPVERKMLAVLRRLPSRLPERAAAEFKALADPETLATMLVLIALFAMLSGGTALVLGIIALGLDVVMSIAAACQIAVLAANQIDLDQAADELAHAVLALGVAVFLSAVVRIAAGLKGAGKGKGPAPTDPSPPNAMKPKTVRKPAPKPAAVKPRGRPPQNPTLERLQGLSREELLMEIRRVSGNPDIVLWEHIAYGEFYTAMRAGPQTAKGLGVRPGDVIGYIGEGGKPAGASSIFGLENITIQNLAPYLDPFILR